MFIFCTFVFWNYFVVTFKYMKMICADIANEGLRYRLRNNCVFFFQILYNFLAICNVTENIL
jgi:hypothetical protein